MFPKCAIVDNKSQYVIYLLTAIYLFLLLMEVILQKGNIMKYCRSIFSTIGMQVSHCSFGIVSYIQCLWACTREMTSAVVMKLFYQPQSHIVGIKLVSFLLNSPIPLLSYQVSPFVVLKIRVRMIVQRLT